VVFRQLVDDDLGCASYLIGDEAAGEAVVVDPAYAIERYLEEAERGGFRIVRALETPTTSPDTGASRSSTACR
jgi:hydroxyacylglutathione hydrolase